MEEVTNPDFGAEKGGLPGGRGNYSLSQGGC